jgi:mRNA deadenylase 3'-5' endonuclease subunit Ccr4
VDLDTITDEVYTNAMKDMFLTEGWQLLLLELEDQVHFLEDIQRITSLDDLRYKQGQLHTIGFLLNFEETVAKAEKEAEEDKESEDDDDGI